MRKLKYIIGRIFGMNYKNMFEALNRIHKKTGKNRVIMFFDMVFCAFRYGAGYMDYEVLCFYNLNSKQRATYVTRTINNTIIRACNNREYYHIFDNKVEFNQVFNQYLKRDWLDMRSASKEDLKSFLSGKTAIIAKPVDASCGEGVQKFTQEDFADSEAFYEKLKADASAQLLEDYVVQHPELSALYPYSVNTLRIMTLIKGETIHIIASIRIGNGGKVVDNINNGGMVTQINLETGELMYPACDMDGKLYEIHPMTGHPIKGFVIPYWKEAVALCKEAALVIPQIRYCGWDVAITPEGPVFIEGNHLPGHDIYQLPAQVPDRIGGMLPKFKEILGDEI